MPKCKICGKKFETLTALYEHHKAVHPNAHFVRPRIEVGRNFLVILIVVIIAFGGFVGYLIYAQSQLNSSTANQGVLGMPISDNLFQNLTGVSYSTLSAIGYNQPGVSPPSSVNGTPVFSGGKPEILYIGAEWCPYCAAERWSLVVALSKFGNFSGLEYMLSAQDDGNISTLSFRNTNYTSQYISFVSVEVQDRNRNPLESPTAEEQDFWNAYTNEKDTFPFIFIDGQYALTGAQYTYSALSGMNWTQIGSQLNNPQSSTAKLIDGAANQLIGAVCTQLKARLNPYPEGLCGESFANLSFSWQDSSSMQYETFLVLSIQGSTTEYTNIRIIKNTEI